jgi:hypothetical protein
MIRDKDMDSGSPVMLHQCRRCGRNFVMELLTGDQYAVQVAVPPSLNFLANLLPQMSGTPERIMAR